MAGKQAPEIVQKFINFLWAHSPGTWKIKYTWYRNILFVSIFVETQESTKHIKVRRNYKLDIITQRESDICGMAIDCVDEIRSEIGV